MQDGLAQIAAALETRDYTTVSNVQVTFYAALCLPCSLSVAPACSALAAAVPLMAPGPARTLPRMCQWVTRCAACSAPLLAPPLLYPVHSTREPHACAQQQLLRRTDGAAAVQTSLTSTDWDECSTWLTVLKRLVRQRMTLP